MKVIASVARIAHRLAAMRRAEGPEFRISLSPAQLLALETAGVFEEPLDEDDEILRAAIRDDQLVTRDPHQIARLVYQLSDGADDYARKRGPRTDAHQRRMYRADCQTFLRLARKLSALAQRHCTP
jgi:hypothetical protein